MTNKKTILTLLTLIFQIILNPKAEAEIYSDDCPLYVGARPLGMGNAFTSVADDADAGFWNPAGIVQWQGVKLTLSTQITDRDDSPLDSKCIAYSYRGLGLFWGNKITFRTNEIKDFNYYSFATRLCPHMSVGASIKFKRRHPASYYQFAGYKSGYDISMMYKSNNYGSYSIMIQNLIDSPALIDTIRVGGSKDITRSILLSVDIGFIFKEPCIKSNIGYEWQLNKHLTIRMGFSTLHPTLGLTFSLKGFSIDYAYIKDNKIGKSFLSARIRL